MGKAAAGQVARQLMRAGLARRTPVLVVENASLPDERIFSTRLDLLPLAVHTAIGDGPAVLLIGEAVRQQPHVSASPATATREP
jgi:uroporphyrin-III C-methyltransferase